MATPSNPLGPITWGLDFNFFQNVTPTASGSGVFNTNCDIAITFPTQTVTFWLPTTGGGSVQYSFNGSTIHGTLDSAGVLGPNFLVFENRPVCKVWFTKTGGTPVVRVEAWGTR